MKHSIIVKFLAVVLASFSLVGAVGSAAAIVSLERAGLYVNGLDELQDPMFESIASEIATDYAELFAADSLGQLPYTLKKSMYSDPLDRSDADSWYVKLSCNGVKLQDDGKESAQYAYIRQYTVAPLYFIASLYSPEEMIPPTTESIPENTDPSQEEADPRVSDFEEITVPDNYLYYSQETTFQGGRLLTYYLYYYQAPEYDVTVCLREDVLDNSSLYLLTTIYPHRFSFILALVACLLSGAICLVYLLNAAGHCADGSIRPGGLNRLPLDLNLLLSACAVYALVQLLLYLYHWVEQEGPHLGNLSLMAVNLLGIAVLVISFLFALAAQIKARDGFIWQHSVIGWFLGRLVALVKLLGNLISSVGRMLPIIWQWLLTGFISGGVLLLCQRLALWNRQLLWLFFLACVVCFAVILYASYCLSVLIRGAQRMSKGDLGFKINTHYLLGNFRTFAEEINTLSETAQLAAKRQMQSERMRSELITNVSHDIKTPLTSIINFVDLLQKPHDDAQQQEYLEVLARQSGQMKKLIEDLIELSKASSGNVSVNLQTINACEAVNQALGEFSDKLESAGIVPLFQQPTVPLLITADGRLTWRVMSNLLSNAVKYAMPGTRLYISLFRLDGQVLLSLKNVSRAPLTTDADELLERFVRGDASRKSEGSGLGLNIAKNLMEVQGGRLELLLDGDLFKVTLIFPAAEDPGC